MSVPVYPAERIRQWDAFTIEKEPVSSVDLMDRAASVFVDWFLSQYGPETPVWIVCGTGNNGGDGLVAARLLSFCNYEVRVILCDFSGKHAPDFQRQRERLPDTVALDVRGEAGSWPEVPAGAAVVEALFGSGLNRSLEGPFAAVVEWLNGLPNTVVSIDLPAGLLADRVTTGICVEADRTFSFETPKLAFFFPENAHRVGQWTFQSIGLHPDFTRLFPSDVYYFTADDAARLYRPRPTFAHKGAFGHALIIAGSLGKTGAALLAARACLRAGAGLLTLHTPSGGLSILQTGIPEAMCLVDPHPAHWTQAPAQGGFAAVGLGCGIGKHPDTAAALGQLLAQAVRPCVLDADALNLLAEHPEWWSRIPKNSILTPHPKEFERLFGPSENAFARLDLLREKARRYQVLIVLKGAYSATATPDGRCFFNSSGNPGMATGGSGDVLTGILTGLLAQGYPPESAALLGVYLHGLAGDLAAATTSQEALLAGDIVQYLGAAWLSLF